MTARRLDDWNPLPAELKLAEGVGTGLTVILGDGTLPPDPPPEDRKIRAGFLRALILGQIPGCPLHEKGVQLRGAYIVGDGPECAETRGLDLEGCNLRSDLALIACRVPNKLVLRSTKLRNLFLNGSHLSAGLVADRLEANGGVFLRSLGIPGSPEFHVFEAHGGVRLLGATLQGNLECDGARLSSAASGIALHADRLTASGSVFLRRLGIPRSQSFQPFASDGEVRVPWSKLGGGLDCIGAHITAGEEGRALTADGLVVRSSVYLNHLVAKGECGYSAQTWLVIYTAQAVG